MGYKQNNPLPMMKSAMKMMKAEKKAGMHRDSAMYMNSPMYSGHSPMERESRELKDMPIVDIEKGDAKGSPAMAAKPDYIDIDKDGNKEESMKEAAKDKKGSPAMKKQGYNDRLDESLAKDGKESSKKQSMKDRRDESKGMEKAEGKGAYSSDPGMSRKSSPANMKEKAAERKQRKGKGEIRVKTGGDPEPTYVSNRRKKRAEKANDGTLEGFAKEQKILDKGRKIKDGSYSSGKPKK